MTASRSTAGPRIPTTGPALGLSAIARSRLVAVIFWGNLLCQMGIILTGGVVRLTGSGLGCSTWPQCEPGQFTPVRTPEMGIHPFIEFGNRTLTGVLGIFSIAVLVAAVVWLRHKGTHFLVLATVPLIGTIVQALVGAVVVWADLHPGAVSPHFLISPIIIAFSTVLLYRLLSPGSRLRPALPPRVMRLFAALAVLAFVVLVLGTLVTGTGPHSGDAGDVTRLMLHPVLISRIHALAVWGFLALLAAIVVLLRRLDAPRHTQRAAWALVVLVLAQGLIGYAQYFTGLPRGLVFLHLLGAALFGAAVTWLGASMFVSDGTRDEDVLGLPGADPALPVPVTPSDEKVRP